MIKLIFIVVGFFGVFEKIADSDQILPGLERQGSRAGQGFHNYDVACFSGFDGRGQIIAGVNEFKIACIAGHCKIIAGDAAFIKFAFFIFSVTGFPA